MLYDLLLNRLERDRISEYLMVTGYEQERNLYYSHRDGSAGFVLEVEPVNFLGHQTLAGLSAFLASKWPKNSIVQFGIYSDPNLDPILNAYRQMRGQYAEVVGNEFKEFLFHWAYKFANHLESKRHQGIDPNEVPVPFRNFRCFVTAKIPAKLNDFYSRSPDLQLLLRNRESLCGALRTSHIWHVNMLPDALIRFLYQLWNPSHPYPLPLYPGENLKERFQKDLEARYANASSNEYDNIRFERPYIGWDTDQYIYDQVVAKDTRMTRYDRFLKLDRCFVQSRTASFPKRIAHSDVNMLLGDIGQANLKQITTPFLFTLNLDLNDQERAIAKKATLVLAQNNALPALRPKIENRHREFMTASKMIEEGETFIQGMVTMNYIAKSKQELEQAAAATSSIWQGLGYSLQKEDGLHLPLYMASHPLGVSHELLTKLKRAKPAPASTFAMLAPITADSRGGGGNPVLLLISRRGQLFSLDLRNSDSNYNARVIAPSGAGKSFYVNAMLISVLSVNGRAFIIDIGRSYQKLCETLGGQFIEFTSDSDICLNIFSLITFSMWTAIDPDVIAQRDTLRSQCEQLLWQMANPTSEISDTEKSLLSRLLGECFDELNSDNEYFSLDRLIDKLREEQRLRNDRNQQDNIPGYLAERLHPWSSKGKHGSWFDGKFNIEFNNPLVILELEELKTNEDLKQVVLLLIMISIEHSLYIAGDRSRSTMVVMDEAWDLMGGANTAKFLEEGYRRARKYGASFVTITQSIFDFRDKNPEAGNAVSANSAFTILLQPKAEEIERAIKENLLTLGEYEKKLIVSTHTLKGKYSEIAVIHPTGAVTLGRLHVDKETELLFTTNPRELALIAEFRKRGLSLKDSIEKTVPVLSELHDKNMDPSDIVNQMGIV